MGGVVKLQGESEYVKALRNIKQNLKEVSSELKANASAYASNSTSVEARQSRQDILKKKLEGQVAVLNNLKKQYASMQETYSQNGERITSLNSEYDAEKQKLEQIGATLGESSQEYKDQQKKVEELEKTISNATETQDGNARAMSNMRVQMNNAQSDINKTTNEITDLGDSIEEAQTPTEELGEAVEDAGEKAESSTHGGRTIFKDVLANLATNVIMSAVEGMKKLGATVVDIGKQALDSYANYEQLIGGVDTLFKSASGTVQKYANDAYKTAGMSANDYMETVTGFSASLIQSLGGDTQKASEYANRADTDMSDNANKMGTNNQDIQNA